MLHDIIHDVDIFLQKHHAVPGITRLNAGACSHHDDLGVRALLVAAHMEFRDLAGGVIAVCLYAAVAMVIVGVLTLLPGLITNNMMERAFSWKRLLCALMIPLTIGAATGGFAWGAGAFGADGLAVNDSYQSANGHPDWRGVKSDEAKKSDDLGGVVRQLGEDIANRVGKAAGDAIDKALSTGKKAWQWLSGGDGKGNVFQKAGDAASGAWDWASGGDGKGNVFQKAGQAAGDLWSSLFG